MNPPKVALSLVWLLCIASFFVATDSTAAGYGRTLFFGLAVVHLVECGYFLRELQRAPGSLPHHLLQTFLFGFVHVSEVRGRTGSG